MQLTYGKRLKQSIKRGYKSLRRSYHRVTEAWTADDLATLLRRLGIGAGDTLMVHSAFGKFTGFHGTPRDVVETLQALIGPEGTLLMPTMPFRGTAVQYAGENQVLDVRDTPSAMGIITETFRHMPGVRRSVHPTHPVAAWGAGAAEMIRDHHEAATPCGRGSPFARLPDRNGKILLLGAGINSMTYFHAMEEDLEPRMPFSPMTRETFVLRARDRDGNVVETTTRLYDPDLSRRRDLRLLIPWFKKLDAWTEEMIGGLDVILVNAADAREVGRTMAENGVYAYRPPAEPSQSGASEAIVRPAPTVAS